MTFAISRGKAYLKLLSIVVVASEPIMVRPHTLWRDLRQIVRGSASFLKHLVSSEHLDIGLGLFSAESGVAKRGVSNKYFARIACVGEEIQNVNLVIDIYALNVPTSINSHYGYIAKTLKVLPRAATAVEIQYDWLQSANFFYEGASHPPDGLWKGTYELPQLYSVMAVLLDPQGNQIDRLAVFQELQV